MRRRSVFAALAAACALSASATSAFAAHDGDPDSRAMTKLFDSQNPTNATNSDLAFWGDRAYAGNYNSFRIFDISNPGGSGAALELPVRRTAAGSDRLAEQAVPIVPALAAAVALSLALLAARRHRPGSAASRALRSAD
jgi:hypothetical protein